MHTVYTVVEVNPVSVVFLNTYVNALCFQEATPKTREDTIQNVQNMTQSGESLTEAERKSK